MATRRRATGTTTIVFVVVVIIVVATAGVLVIIIQAKPGGPNDLLSTPSTSKTTTSTAASMAVKGIEFNTSLNSSSVVQGGNAIVVRMSLFNALNKSNSVSPAREWRLTLQSEIDSSQSISCVDEIGPFAIAVYHGFYDSGNYSNGTPLSIFPWPTQEKGFNWCNYYIGEPSWLGSSYYLFQPQSSAATLYLSGQGSWNTTMHVTIILKPLTYTFPVGQYTVVCGDEWGDTQVSHFVIEPPR